MLNFKNLLLKVRNLSKKKLIVVAVAVALIGVGALVYANQEKLGLNIFWGSSPQKTAQKAIEYINENVVSQGISASLMSVKKESGVYKIHIEVGGQEYDSYVTPDGKYLFPVVYDMSPVSAEETESQSGQEKATCEDLKKSDKPILEAFVVSQCPYGLQMQRILYEVVKNIPSLAADIKVEYIGAIEEEKITSMHGDVEAQENLRQICVREEQVDKYWNYIACHIEKGDVEGCLTSANVNKTQLNTCMTDKTKGLKYAEVDFNSQDKYNVSGSPTLFLNGEKVSEFDFGGRTAEALKTLLCCGFSSTPDLCSQKLTEDSAATGFSDTYTGSGSSSENGGCQ